MPFSMRKRYDDSCFVADAHFENAQAIELNPSSYAGYQVKHAALRGLQRYDEAIETFGIMLSKLDDASEVQIRGKTQWGTGGLSRKYLSR